MNQVLFLLFKPSSQARSSALAATDPGKCTSTLEFPSIKNPGAGDMAQLDMCLLRLDEVLGLIPSTPSTGCVGACL